MVKLKDVVSAIETFAPFNFKENWDNVGLQVGKSDKEIRRILLALTPTQDVLERAKNNDIDLIITHHPLIFRSLKSVTDQSATGEAIYSLIESDIAHFCAHTNFDVCVGGVNDILAKYIDVKPEFYLDKIFEETYYKLVVYVPNDHFATVREALFNAGAGRLGEYSECSWRTYGEGSFKPTHKANPYVASAPGTRHYEEEVRFEVIVQQQILDSVLRTLLNTHPYETPAYDLYKLEGVGKSYGAGRIGKLLKPMQFSAYSIFVKERLGIDYLRVVGEDREISRVAFCGGSGASYIKRAADLGADCYLTGDLKYHDAQLAKELGINLIDITHFNSEKIALLGMKAYLEKTFPNLKMVLDDEEKDFFYLV